MSPIVILLLMCATVVGMFLLSAALISLAARAGRGVEAIAETSSATPQGISAT